jgi:tRNA nucleotidyltransferase (CCA-adding enzyme)
MKIYKVGGCNRDDIIGRPSNDIDYSVEADSYETMKEYILQSYKIVYEQPHYFTIKAYKEKNMYDFVLCRKDEKYKDGRHPESVKQGNILDDLSRRDFTMNSIAVCIESGKMIDPYNGIEDIKNRIIRCTGNTHIRLNEDVLRLVRAFRFHIVLDFEIDTDIILYFWDTNYIKKLELISKERIVSELSKCFAFNTMKTIKTLSKYPLFSDYLFEKIMILKPVML